MEGASETGRRQAPAAGAAEPAGAGEPRLNLVGVPAEELRRLLAPELDRPFRLAQVVTWVVLRQATGFEQMTDLPAALRRSLAERFCLTDPELVAAATSGDGSVKVLLRLADGLTVEAVTMPGERKTTLCLSSQAGCALGCRFCVTGRLGAGRNLSSAEIVGQYRLMVRRLVPPPARVNVVFMGMGEPLLNTDALGAALEVLRQTVSPRRITVSTAGVIPGIRWLAGRPHPPKLAVSLNAPDQARRQHLMPIARRYPLPELMAELGRFPLPGGRRLTFEYVLIRGFNDDPADARALVRLLAPLRAKVNLIPLNPDPSLPAGLEPSPPAAVEAFAQTLRDHGLTAPVRSSRGQDIAAACGRLKRASAPSTGT